MQDLKVLSKLMREVNVEREPLSCSIVTAWVGKQAAIEMGATSQRLVYVLEA